MTEGDQGGGAYNDPKIAINRVYTKKGDSGKTALVGGQKVDKDDARIDVYGTVDELNAFVGAARHGALQSEKHARDRAADRLAGLAASLLRVQHELFNLGSILATLPEDVHPKQPRVTEVEVLALEEDIDACQEALDPLRSFVLPGDSRLNADLHLARTVCRRAERQLVAFARDNEIDPVAIRYLNRLSDALFVWSRFASHVEGVPETLWQPNEAAGGRPSKP